MAKESGARFDFTADMRALAEQSVAQAKEAFDTFAAAAQHAVNTAESQAIGAQTGAKEVGQLAMTFAERNIASSFDFAQRLLAAKAPEEVMAMHADYVSAQMAALTEQAKELTGRAAKMAGKAERH